MGANSGTITGHNINNYLVGKGILTFKMNTPVVDSIARDLGNISKISALVKPTTLDHYTQRNGKKLKDLSVVIQTDVTLAWTMDEMSAENMALYLMGPIGNSPPHHVVINIAQYSQIIGEFIFTGKNDVGPRWTVTLPNVSIQPAKALDMIGDTWADMDMTGDVLVDEDGNFGTFAAIMNDTAVA